MKIKLTNGRAASQNDIARLQHRVGELLAPEFLDFIAKNDGAKPETNIFKIGAENGSGVNGFIPVAKIADEMQRIENLPAQSFPVAWAEGGNFVIINQALGGSVFFWDHELPEDLVKLAENFSAFLGLLEPFDVSSIELQPGQVKRVWIDPNFLKKLKGNGA